MADINEVGTDKEEEDAFAEALGQALDQALGQGDEIIEIPEIEDPLEMLDSLRVQIGEFAQDSLARARREADDDKRRDVFLRHAVSMTTTYMQVIEFTEKRRPAPIFVRGKNGK